MLMPAMLARPMPQAWLIPASQVEYQRRPNGELAVLGEGAT